MAHAPKSKDTHRRLPEPNRITEAFNRLAGERVFYALVHGALTPAVLRRLLKDEVPAKTAAEMPQDAWASYAVHVGLEDWQFGDELAQALHDRVGWDEEPKDLADYERVVADRPLEALWMAALSELKPVKKAFPRLARECVAAYRASPACPPPTWEFVEALLDLQSETAHTVRDAERAADDAEKRNAADRERLEDLREELRRLRRENSELRGEKAQLERRVQAAAPGQAAPADSRADELERRLRRAEKENEHLHRELTRLRSPVPPPAAEPPAPARAGPPPAAAPAPPEESPTHAQAIAEDPNPRRRVMRQILRKLFTKGKIGASHTHEDNVYRGVADHEKGIAKDALELLYLEGFMVPKPTTADPHVSLRADRAGEIQDLIAGEVHNPRLRRFVEEG